jgi:hypothetical protein
MQEVALLTAEPVTYRHEQNLTVNADKWYERWLVRLLFRLKILKHETKVLQNPITFVEVPTPKTVKDLREAIDSFYNSYGCRPTVVYMGSEEYDDMMRDARLNHFSYSLGTADVPSCLFGLKVVVCRHMKGIFVWSNELK